MSEALLLRRRAMMGSKKVVDPISLYATDGLILWLDGIKNTQSGHDANAEYWEDLSGNGLDYHYLSANIIHDTYLDVNGVGGDKKRGFTNSEKQAIQNGTVEIVYDFANTGTDARIVLPLGNVPNTTSRKNGCILFGTGNTTKSIAITDGIHTYNSSMYKDGETAANQGQTVSWGSTHEYLFSWGGSTYGFKGCVYALRIYGRVLSEAEIIKNFQADRVRFGIS